MHKRYKKINFNEVELYTIAKADTIIGEYSDKGYRLTLRQLYYQFVARDLFPSQWADPETGSTNNDKAYKKLGVIISDARLNGLIDWEAIEDVTRSLKAIRHFANPSESIKDAADCHWLDKWQDCSYRPEVWVEKDAMASIARRSCSALDIPSFSCRGYTSQTAIWEAGQRMMRIAENGQIPVVLHLGDHDPSGVNMSKDIEDRLFMFMEDQADKLIFRRIALNMDQVKLYSPPPNPAKKTDTRYAKYKKLYGDESWELDALDPTIIDNLIRDNVAEFRDDSAFDALLEREKKERKLLRKTSTHWDALVKTVAAIKDKRQ